jgi:hypothetical protein
MNKMHNYARKRFEQFCFIFNEVIAKITKAIFPAKILAPIDIAHNADKTLKLVTKLGLSKNVEKYLGLSVAKSTLYNI